MSALTPQPLSDAFWDAIVPHVPRSYPLRNNPWSDARGVMAIILHLLREHRPWASLGSEGPLSARLTKNRFYRWKKAGVFDKLWELGLHTTPEMRGITREMLKDVGKDMVPLGLDRSSLPLATANMRPLSKAFWYAIAPHVPQAHRRGALKESEEPVDPSIEMAVFLHLLRHGRSWGALSAQRMRTKYTRWKKAGVFDKLWELGLDTLPEMNGITREMIDKSWINKKKRVSKLKRVVDQASPLVRATKLPKKARLGERHGRARLTRESVLEIRAWAKAVLEAGAIPPWTTKAAEYQVSEGAIRDIVHRRTWTHI